MSGNGYSHASHTTKVLKSSKARCGQRMVLQCMCARADFKKPEVVITKNQISDYTGLERKAVQRAIKFLREEGTIRPIAGERGGKGVAVRYQLVNIRPDANEGDERGQKSADIDRRSKQYRDTLARIMSERGVDYGTARNMADEEMGVAA